MQSVARRAGLWRRTQGIARTCTSVSSSSHGSPNVYTCKQQHSKPGWDPICEDGVFVDKDGDDILVRPPLQSLHKATFIMPKPTNPLWKEHTNVIEVVNTPGQAGTGVREALIVEKFPAFATTDKGRVAQQTQHRLQDALLGQLGDSSTQVEESSESQQIGNRKRARIMQEEEDEQAILAGEITLSPFQKVRKNGKVVTIFHVATGGMWRLPIESKVAASEDECSDPCLQYHKIAVHHEDLGKLAARTLRRGMQVYVEGELETRVFNDAVTGIVKREREIAVHTRGQIMAWTEKGPISLEYH
ncbi:hypothetical protein L7F22_036419 [Adiantum nelumboides]|nr:hypothetical protein [Adiantum nelumboides]